MSDKPKLFALLVAIDNYRYPVSPLGGCVNDIKRVAAYLEEDNDFDVHIQKLLDADATRENVERGFREHLTQAGDGDVAFFYYSGHGAQEYADESVWRFEPSGKLEGLVLYDSIPDSGRRYRLLADKEIRYLIHRVETRDPGGKAKAEPPHILTIFDCCHSGENTRNLYVLEEGVAGDEEIRERRFRPEPTARMSTVLPQRDWADFLFADQDNISAESLKKNKLAEVLPEGKHVQIAACRSDESSYEVGGSGVFTKNLLEVLTRSRGAVSYYDLRSRLKNFIKNQFKQTPQIYETGDNHQIYRTFLNKELAGKPLYGNIIYNPREGWVMDLGALHGVSAMADTVRVVDPHSKKAYEAQIMDVSPGLTRLEFKEETEKQLDKEERYFGYIENFLSAPIHVFIDNHDENEEAELRLRQRLETEGKNLFYTDEEKHADYTVQIQFGEYVITQPGDRFRPVVLPVDILAQDSEKFTADYLSHISQWEYVKNLHNDGPNRLPVDAIRVEFFRVMPEGELQPVPIENEEIFTEYKKTADGYGGKIRVKVTNLAPFPVNVGMVYLSRNFEVYPELLANVVQRLDGATAEGKEGGSVWVFDGDDIDLDFERAVEVFNWKESETHFMLIASREDIGIVQMQQEELPDPAKMADAPARGIKKGIKKKTRGDENVAADAWMTRLLTLRIPNPKYQDPKAGSPDWLSSLEGTAAAPYLKHLFGK